MFRSVTFWTDPDKIGSIEYIDVFSLRSLYEACKKEARERCTRLELFSHGADYTRGKFMHAKIVIFTVLRIRDKHPGSRIQDPGFIISRISDSTTATKEEGNINLLSYLFLCSHKYHKIVNYFTLEQVKKN